MTAVERELFTRDGYVHLRGFHPRSRLTGLRNTLLKEVERLSRGGTSRSLRKLPIFQQITKLSSLIDARDVHETLVTAELIDVVCSVAGRRAPTVQQTQLLLSPPKQGQWTLSGLNWHVDVKEGSRDDVPGVQAFFLIDDVVPHGGGTLAVAGSHRLRHSGARSLSALREVLKSDSQPVTRLQALDAHIIEMSGKAGDVFLMDMRVLHSPSINESENMRMMATCRCLLF